MPKLEAREYDSFEQIKQTDENGSEFWYARDLQKALGYAKWENFSKVIDRAMLACKNSVSSEMAVFAEVGKNGGMSQNDVSAVNAHFPKVRKMIELGKGAQKEVIDYKLTRYACYLIIQNGDPRKEIIALWQTYFAIQTRRQANETHYKIAEKIRNAMIEMGTTLPENLPTPKDSIQIIEREEIRKLRNSQTKLMLDE